MDKKVIHTVFEHTAGQYPERIAVETETSSVNYDMLNRQANILAHLLRHSGCTDGTIVNVVAPSSVETVIAVLGVFKSGCIYLPVDLSFAEKRLRQIFTDTFDGILVVAASAYDTVLKVMDELAVSPNHMIVIEEGVLPRLFSKKQVALEEQINAYQPDWDQNLTLTVNGESSNYIFYTSGSTGEGKAILGAHAGISHFVHWEIKEFGINSDFRISQLAQVTFDASLRDIFTALIAGGTVCIPAAETRSNPSKLLNYIQQSRLTLIHCVPSLFRLLIKELQAAGTERYDLSHLRYILMAGELLYAKDINGWRKAAGDSVTLVNLYGATETTLVKTFYRIGAVTENPAQIIPVGIPISNTAVAIVRDGQLCIVGEIGELYIKTPFMTKGYYRNEALTAEVFVQNPLLTNERDIVYKSGDQGRYLPDGNIEVLGRLDSMVKVNGIRVELGEIERAMLSDENFTGVVVKTHRTEDNLITLVAYYTGKETPAEEIQHRLSSLINRPAIPSWFIHLDEFPLNINGKVDKKALPLPEDILTGGDKYEAPEGVTENQLAEFWKEILGLKKISRSVSFFSVGGHSLRAIQLVARIQNEMGVNLRIADIFTNRTIREQALLIGTTQQTSGVVIANADIAERYPLSSAQKRLWILSQLEESNVAYNMPALFSLQGHPDIPALEKAFHSMIERHEILRTVFREDEHGVVWQYILSPEQSGFNFQHKDLSDENEIIELLNADIEEVATQPFSPEKGPLLRATLIHIAADKWVLAYVMHHMISDGWSMRVLFDELMQWYAIHAGLTREAPAPLRIQYKDYAVWQQQQLLDGELKQEKEYWLSLFADEVPVLNLPLDKPRPAVKTFNGAMVTRTMDKATTDKLIQYCNGQNGTLFMGLLTTLNILLHRYTGQEDIVTGSPVAGRIHPDLEDQLGCYLNTIALRCRFSGEYSFNQLFREVNNIALEAFHHQRYPFDDLVQDLGKQQDLSRNPLFDVTLALQNTARAGNTSVQTTLPVTVSSYTTATNPTSKFDLTFNVAETDDGIQLGLEYNTDLFTKSTAERIVLHFENIMLAGIFHPETPVNELEYLSPAERKRILEDYSGTKVVYPSDKTIPALFEEQVLKTPDRKALGFENEQFTYRELNEEINRFSNLLQKEYGVREGDKVGIRLPRSGQLIVAVLAVLKNGAAYVPLDPEYPAERRAFMEKDCACRMVIDEEVLEVFSNRKIQYADSNPVTVRTPESIAYIMYTSGSTGLPKGVVVTDRNVVRLVKPGSFARLTGNEVILSTGSFSFDATTFEYWGALLNGGYLRMCTQETLLETALLKAAIRTHAVDTMWFTAGWFNQLVDTDITVFDGLKTVLAGGDKLSPAHVAQLTDRYRKIKVINGYGPTENTTFSLTYAMQHPSPAVIPIGKPIENSTAYILDKKGLLVPEGVFGEITVGGDGLSVGYLNNPALTKEKFITNPYGENGKLYKTGDLGRWLPDGNIEFAGRADDQLKIRGYRVEPGEIENILQQHEAVDAAVVMARQKNGEEKSLVAYIVTNNKGGTDTARAFLAARVPGYMVPEYWVEMDRFPLTTNGKTDRRQLPDPEGKQQEGNASYVPPQTEIQKHLVEVCQDVLKKKVGITDNFFMLGGDSIKSIQIVSRMKQRGYKLAIRDILSSPVIRELERHVKPVARIPDQEPVTGTVIMGPVQVEFFEKQFSNRHHYNQSVLLESSSSLSPDALKAVLAKITAHHDMLRANFREGKDGWIQEINNKDEAYSFELAENTDDETFTKICERIQSTVELMHGPMLRACLFKQEGKDRLLLVIHHLVVDGVSWRILFEDIAALYSRYMEGKSLELPLKSDSFSYRTKELSGYAMSLALQEEEAWWSATEEAPYSVLKPDFPEGTNCAGDAVTLSFALSKENTAQLLGPCYAAYKTDVNDILLTAAGLALHELFGLRKLLVKMEGHGREDAGMQTDLSRTVGWFTSTFPVILDIDEMNDRIRTLIAVKETLRRVPGKGMGYAVLRYMARKNYRLNPQVTFNYLGDFGKGVQSGGKQPLFSFSGQYHGKNTPDDMERDALIDITGVVSGGAIQVSTVYSGKQFSAAKMEQFIRKFQRHLEGIVVLLSAEKKKYLTPADLTWKNLSLEEVQQLDEEGLEDIYPLSPLQMGLYYHWLSKPGSPVYVQQISYRMRGSFDPQLAIKSYAQLVKRHPMLRTRFSRDYGVKPMQLVYRNAMPAVLYIDSTAPGQTPPEKYKREDQSKGFDLHADTQMRLTILKLDEGLHELIWTFHHIIMDGWSAARLMGEFFEVYRAGKNGAVAKLPAVKPYAGYINWLEKKHTIHSLAYWENYLKEYNTVASLPKWPGNKKKGYRGEKGSLVLSGKRKELIQQFCSAEGITENNFYLAIWGLLLAKYNNTDDVVFGTVVSGRAPEVDGAEEMIGLFINTIPVRIKPDPSMHLKDLFRKTQQDAIEGAAHHYVQLAELQARSAPGRDLFDHIVVFENYPVERVIDKTVRQDQHEEKLVVEHLKLEEQSSYDFFITIVPGTTTEVNFNYNAYVFTDRQVERIGEHFSALIDKALEDPLRELKSCTCITAQELQQLETFNHTDHSYRSDQTLVTLFEEKAARMPDKKILFFEDSSFTFKTLNETANQMGAWLRSEYALQPDDRVSIQLDRSEWMIIAILAVLKSGAAYVPVDPAYPEERADYIFKDSGSKVMITEDIVRTFRTIQKQYSVENLPRVNKPSDLVYVIYTSGSTGKPKGCMLEHSSIVNRLQWMWEQYAFTTEDVILQKTTFTFDVSVWELFLPLCFGAAMVLCHRDDIAVPERIISLIRKHHVTCMHFVPGMLNAFTGSLFERDTIAEELKSLRLVITSGEALQVQTIRNWYERVSTPIHNLYGPTEASVDVTFHPTAPGDEFMLIGKPVWNTQLYIIGADGQLQPPGIPGELCIAGTGLARGYINNSSLTAEKFTHNPFRSGSKMYHTGDIARWIEDGSIEYIGRKDGQVKIRGHRIESGEIEAVLLEHPDVENAVVIVKQTGASRDKELAVFLVCKKDVSTTSLRQWLLSKLPIYMIPAYWVRLEQMPLTASGKADRKGLEQMSLHDEKEEQEYTAPRTRTEILIAEAWRAVLEVKRVSITENFFDVGGNSIKLIELSGLVSKTLGTTVSVPELFQYPTIAGLAAYLTVNEKETEDPGYDHAALLDDISKFG